MVFMKKETNPDISKTTILVLVFLALIISILGTWTVLTTVDDVLSNPQTAKAVHQESDSGPTGAVIGLYVEDRSDDSNG